MLENVVLHNALNKTGCINYNKGGIKYCFGFQPCSDKFVDNFILRVLVADYFIQKNRYVEVGSINRIIRAMLNRSGLEKCKVKAIILSCANVIPAEMLTKMPWHDKVLFPRLQNSVCQCRIRVSIAISKDKGVLQTRTFSQRHRHHHGLCG